MVGVAPDATLISIRQSSVAFGPARPNPRDLEQRRKAGDIMTLAKAIRHAADLGVQVINVSLASCINAATPVNQDRAGRGGALCRGGEGRGDRRRRRQQG